MKPFAPVLFILLLGACSQDISKSTETPAITYPETRKSDQTDTYFGVNVADPYRWLEDENSAETNTWVEAQNQVTNAYLNTIPFRDQIKKRLTEVWNYEKFTAPSHKSGHYFQYRNNGIQNQYVLYIMQNAGDTGNVLIDPNKLNAEGTTALTDFSVSDDGTMAVYGTSDAGSDWKTFNVIKLPSGELLEDQIRWVKFSGASWFRDGFFYSRFELPDTSKALSSTNLNSKVYYHKVGTSQDEDKIIFRDSLHPHRNFYTDVTTDEKYLIISESETTSGNGLFIRDLTKENSPIVRMAEGFRYDYQVIDHQQGKLLILTNDNAPRYRLMIADPANPARENWKELIPEQAEVMKSVDLLDGKLLVRYLKDVTDRLFVYNLNGVQELEVQLPGLGVIGSFNSRAEDSTAYFSFNTFTAPPVIFRLTTSTMSPELVQRSEIAFNSDEYITEQVFYKAKDGTSIPMFLTFKKGIVKDGKNPLLLYGYGGFNISITPGFRTDHTVFLENGGIYAVANIRGGGEYGKEWHKAGTQLHKQNVFDDFIAAAEYLIYEGYTSQERIAITGRSNGGLLIGAVMTQRPELFKVAVPVVGVLDMLRYHQFTIGRAWATDYGTSEDEKQFHYLLGYSPLHNIKKADYPATLVMTGDHDDRVVPAHSYKFAATLQENHTGSDPVLIRIDRDAGHGAGKPVSKYIDESTDMWSFIFYQLGMRMEENL